MPIQIIGKSVLGDLGFCQVPSKMREEYCAQLKKIKNHLHCDNLISTSMTGYAEIEATDGKYFPKIRAYSQDTRLMFCPHSIYCYCKRGQDHLRPGCDFVVWDSRKGHTAITFSREAPVLAFESSTGFKSLGVIFRKSLMEYGDYLFSTIKDSLGGEITITLVTCNHFQYPEGSIPSIIQNLADKYHMTCIIGEDSEKNSECFHRNEKGNHVVALC